MLTAVLLLASLSSAPCTGLAPQRAASFADSYVDAVEKLNERHARDPGEATEDELAAKFPRKATQAYEKLMALEPSDDVDAALVEVARAALDLARLEDFDAVRARLTESSPEAAAELGTAFARPRYLLLGEGGIELDYLRRFAEVFDAILAGYDELFGFAEWSKVPGKKLRVRIHLEEKIERPPHFAPQYPWHSEIDFPVIDAERFSSPTGDGKFLFYGLCHELGHVIAMWGDRDLEEDRHAWAHYTGVLLVEHLSREVDDAWIKNAGDVRWRSLSLERERVRNIDPGFEDRDQVLALLIELHDLVGPEAIGAAINALDEKDRRLRVNHVRYYRFAELHEGLKGVVKKKSQRKRLDELLP